jgi:predicted metal-dependent RNase
VKYVQAADQTQLKKIFLVHGEITQIEKFSSKLKEVGVKKDICIPVTGEKAEV